MADAVRYFLPDQPGLARTLWGKLEALKAEKSAQLLHAQDWPDFKERRGVINGLQAALEECAEAEKQHGD